jgi:ABC-type branched-subunit amino acid transport system ATPase component
MSMSVNEKPRAVGSHDEGSPALIVRGVSVAFGGTKAIDDLSFTFDSGTLGIVGPNGAGKSTILNVLSGFIRPNSGSILYDNRELLRKPAYSRSSLSIGRTFQDPVHAEAMTVRENLFSGRTSTMTDDAAQLLTLLNLEQWFDRDVGGLPYGVRKLLDNGRALVKVPHLLLCDEPLSGLDEDERNHMEETLSRIALGGVSLIVVEHDVARIRRLADRIIAVETGRIIADGAPDHVLADPAVIAAFTGEEPEANTQPEAELRGPVQPATRSDGIKDGSDDA